MNAFDSNPTLSGCLFIKNSTQLSSGGGMNNSNSNPNIINCIFINNNAINFGGGILNYGNSNPTITNCTFDKNNAGISGGGIYNDTGTNSVVINSIFWKNTDTADYQIFGLYDISYSLVNGGFTGEGNIDADPLFVDSANGDYRLSDKSPCIGAGTAAGAPTNDIEGNPRGALPDIGAYENARDSRIFTLEDGLVAYYPFDGNADDKSGNGYNGVAKNGAVLTHGINGTANNAYHFDGTDDWIDIPNFNTDFTETAFTFNVWFEIDAVKSRQVIFWIRDDQPSIGLTTGSTIYFQHRMNINVPPVPVDEYTDYKSNPIAVGVWYMATYTYNSADNTLRFYLNGKEVGWRKLGSNFIKSSTNVFRIGLDDYSSRTFNGTIDEFRIYNRALSEAEIKEIYGIHHTDETIIYTDATFTGIGTGKPDATYKSLTEAINNVASSNCTIRVAKGTYNESLTLSNVNGLKIEGGWNHSSGTWTRDIKIDPNLTVIAPGENTLSIDINMVSNAIIDGFSLQNGLWVKNANQLQLINNIAVGTNPLKIEDSENILIAHNSFVGKSETSDAGYGIVLIDSGAIEIANNFIRADNVGIHFNGNSSTPTISKIINNTIYIRNISHPAFGIKLETSTEKIVEIENNVLYLQGSNLLKEENPFNILTGIQEIGTTATPKKLSKNQFYGYIENIIFYKDDKVIIRDSRELNNSNILSDIPETGGNYYCVPYPVNEPYVPCAEIEESPCMDITLIPIPTGIDADNDGLPDDWEIYYFNDITLYNGPEDDELDYNRFSLGDGLTVSEEFINHINPNNSDTDGDGIDDGWEVTYGFEPLNHKDASEDRDGDGYSNFHEYKSGTNPSNPSSYSAAVIFSVPSGFETIQEAIDEAVSQGGGKIYVHEGIYEENIDIYDNIWVIALGDPAKTIINGVKNKDVVTMSNLQEGGIVGFTIQQTSSKARAKVSNSKFAGIKCMGGNTPVIANCIIKNNRYGINSGGNAKPFIVNNIIKDNSEEGIDINGNIAVTFFNNIVINNGGLKIDTDLSSTISYNNCWNNGTADCSLYFSSDKGNISEESVFFNLPLEDYHLSADSICLDKGHTYLKDRNRTRSDMGVYGRKWFDNMDDTDEDGITDDWEMYHKTDPTKPETNNKTYIIEANAGSNGSIEPFGKLIIEHNQDQTFLITHDTGYHISDVKVDGISLGAVTEYTFKKIKADHIIHATFERDEIDKYTIIADSEENGTIIPSGNISVEYGKSRSFIIKADDKYRILDVIVDGKSVGVISEYIFNDIKSNHTIHAVFKTDEYTITASSDENGQIEPSGVISAKYGAEQKFIIKSNICFHIADVIVDGKSVGAVNEYLLDVTGNHTVQAVFERDSFVIKVETVENGAGTLSEFINLPCGSDGKIKIPPAPPCYHLADVTVDGKSVGAVTEYLFENVTGDHTVQAVFERDSYVIKAEHNEGGTVAPSGDITVPCGSEQKIVITPLHCYHIADVIIDGKSVGAVTEYVFENVTGSHTVQAVFERDSFVIKTEHNEGGTVEPSGDITVPCGSEQKIVITPLHCFHIADVIIDGKSAGAVAEYVFENVTGNHTVQAVFERDSSVIKTEHNEGGTVTPSGDISVPCGSDQKIVITPLPCFHIADVIIDGKSAGAVAEYLFENVTGDHTVRAVFERDSFVIKTEHNEGGIVTPSGDITVPCGSDQKVVITPLYCYHIADVIIDGKSAGAVTEYVFENVTGDHTVRAVFERDSFVIKAKAGENGNISPSGEISVACGSDQEFIITPDVGYSIATILIDNVAVETENPYKFENVNAEHTIAVLFTNGVPEISKIDDQTVNKNSSTESLSFTIKDLETPADELTLSVSSSNSELVPVSNITFGGDNEQRTVTVKPAENMSGETTITITVKDKPGLAAETHFVLTVKNNVPTAKNSEFKTDEDSSFSGTLNAEDIDNDSLTYTLVEQTAKGLVEIKTAGEFTYIPDDDKNGTDSFTFKVNDGEADSEAATVNIVINPVNDKHVADAGMDQDVIERTTVTLDGSKSSDVDNEKISYQWEQVEGKNVAISDSTAVQPIFTAPEVGLNGTQLKFNLTVSDDKESSTDTVIISVFNIVPAGDINGDGNVDLPDAILALNILAGTNNDDKIWIDADVNGDGKIGIEEVIYILQSVCGLREEN